MAQNHGLVLCIFLHFACWKYRYSILILRFLNNLNIYIFLEITTSEELLWQGSSWIIILTIKFRCLKPYYFRYPSSHPKYTFYLQFNYLFFVQGHLLFPPMGRHALGLVGESTITRRICIHLCLDEIVSVLMPFGIFIFSLVGLLLQVNWCIWYVHTSNAYAHVQVLYMGHMRLLDTRYSLWLILKAYQVYI